MVSIEWVEIVTDWPPVSNFVCSALNAFSGDRLPVAPYGLLLLSLTQPYGIANVVDTWLLTAWLSVLCNSLIQNANSIKLSKACKNHFSESNGISFSENTIRLRKYYWIYLAGFNHNSICVWKTTFRFYTTFTRCTPTHVHPHLHTHPHI